MIPRGVQQRLYNLAFDLHKAAFRATDGRIGGRIRGAPVVLVNHVGRRSGKRRTTPLLYLPDGENVVVIASRGGARRHPAWWLNLREMSETEIHLPGGRRQVEVREATPAERERLWPRVVEMYPDYGKYQARTEREIPLGILSPAA